ncbi:CopY/TcrY family copper transport repressor [Weissella paramesenteroides]|uniref:CopY/TcrY family copper transport repressor n=1 Tax=Weissella paramesenteroides TaxID=1249 RepID=UPI003F27ADFA
MAQAKEMSTAEWELMRVVWTLHETSSSDIIMAIHGKKDWTESTIKTLLRRLVQKEVLTTRKEGRKFIYRPLIGEDDAMDQMTTEVFGRLCRMKKGRTLTKLVANTTLSQSDIKELQKTLAEKLQTAPEMVACDCIAPMSCGHCENDSVMA